MGQSRELKSTPLHHDSVVTDLFYIPGKPSSKNDILITNEGDGLPRLWNARTGLSSEVRLAHPIKNTPDPDSTQIWKLNDIRWAMHFEDNIYFFQLTQENDQASLPLYFEQTDSNFISYNSERHVPLLLLDSAETLQEQSPFPVTTLDTDINFTFNSGEYISETQHNRTNL